MQPPILIASFVIVLVVTPHALAQDAEKFFEDNCAMCHNIGGEPAAGPDLKDISQRRDREWLLRFIRDPEESAEHDRDAAALVKQFDNGMPATKGASKQTLAAVLAYIDAKSASPSAMTAPPASVPAPRPTTPDDIVVGRAFFAGGRALANAGPACVSCHQLSGTPAFAGGALGPDLSRSYQRLGGQAGVTTWLGNPPTKVMRAVYRNTPLTTDETHALASLLATANQQPPTRSSPALFVVVGLVGMSGLLATGGVVWARRFRGVRRVMVARAYPERGRIVRSRIVRAEGGQR